MPPPVSTRRGITDGVNPVQETSGAAVLANILPGLGIDEFLTRTDVVAGTTSNFLTVALGAPIAVTDTAGTVQTEYTYEPFGKTTVTGASNTNPYQYTGRENDGTGLYYYRARYYSPQLQRFISEDPMEFGSGDFNLYAYVVNNPLLYIDPFGLVPGACMNPAEDCGPSGKDHWSDPPRKNPKSNPPPPVPPEPPTSSETTGPTYQDIIDTIDMIMGQACEAGIAYGCGLVVKNPPACAALAVGICNFRPKTRDRR